MYTIMNKKVVCPHPMIQMTPNELFAQRLKKRKSLIHKCRCHSDVIATRSVYIEANGERLTLYFCEPCHDGFCDLMRKTYGVKL